MAGSITRSTRKRQRLIRDLCVKKAKLLSDEFCELDDINDAQSMEAAKEDKESVDSGEAPQQGGLDTCLSVKGEEKEKWKAELQQGLKKDGWKWSMLENIKEEWKAQLIGKCRTEYCASLISSSSISRAAAQLLADLDQEGSSSLSDTKGIPVWKADLLAKTKQEWKLKVLSHMKDEYLASILSNCEFEWLSHVLHKLFTKIEETNSEELLSFVNIIARSKYPWQAQLLADKLLNCVYSDPASFELKASLVLACSDQRIAEKILRAEDWKVALLCNVTEKWKFRMIVDTTEEWKCELLSTADKYAIAKAIFESDSKYKATAIANSKSSTVIKLIQNVNYCEEWKADLLLQNSKSEWKALLIDQCNDEWVAYKIAECEERWRAEMLLKVTQQGPQAIDWKVNVIAELNSRNLCEIVLNRCTFVWEANLIKDVYKKYPWKIEYILKCGQRGDDEEWRANIIASNTSFQWQAEYVIKADSELKATLLSNITNKRRAGFVLEATEEWRISLLSDEKRVKDDWRMPLVANKECCEWKALLLTACRTEWQARLVMNAEEEWRCRLLASGSEIEEWRAKVVAEEKEEWKCNLICNYTSEQWRVELMRKVQSEWQIRLINEIPQVWKVRIIAGLRPDQQTMASSILSQSVTTEEHAREILQGFGSASRMFH